TKTTILVELTVLWEEGAEAANERKRGKYPDPKAECIEAGDPTFPVTNLRDGIHWVPQLPGNIGLPSAEGCQAKLRKEGTLSQFRNATHCLACCLMVCQFGFNLPPPFAAQTVGGRRHLSGSQQAVCDFERAADMDAVTHMSLHATQREETCAMRVWTCVFSSVRALEHKP
ncbi:unnamed protein product, partial [Pleuronectes platessa]